MVYWFIDIFCIANIVAIVEMTVETMGWILHLTKPSVTNAISVEFRTIANTIYNPSILFYCSILLSVTSINNINNIKCNIDHDINNSGLLKQIRYRHGTIKRTQYSRSSQSIENKRTRFRKHSISCTDIRPLLIHRNTIIQFPSSSPNSF